MSFWPIDLEGWVDVSSKTLATLFAVTGGAWGLAQYLRSTRIRAAETLLKVEEEFRHILPTYEEIENLTSYRKLIQPVLNALANGTLDAAGLEKLTELDRCLRFLYVCSVLNEALRADRAFGVRGGALVRAYYYYLGILLPEAQKQRPDLHAYTKRNYPVLTKWIVKHMEEIRDARGLDRE